MVEKDDRYEMVNAKMIVLTDEEMDELELFNFTYYTRPMASWNYKCNAHNGSEIRHAYHLMLDSVLRHEHE